MTKFNELERATLTTLTVEQKQWEDCIDYMVPSRVSDGRYYNPGSLVVTLMSAKTNLEHKNELN